MAEVTASFTQYEIGELNYYLILNYNREPSYLLDDEIGKCRMILPLK